MAAALGRAWSLIDRWLVHAANQYVYHGFFFNVAIRVGPLDANGHEAMAEWDNPHTNFLSPKSCRHMQAGTIEFSIVCGPTN